VSVAYFHFLRAYNNRPAGPGVWLGYFFAIGILALSLSGHVVTNVRLVNGFLYHNIHPWDYILACVLVPLLTASIIMLRNRYRNSTDPIDRNRTMYLMVGWSAL